MEFKFEGIDEIEMKLDAIASDSNIISAVKKACALVEGAAQEKAPKRTGALRRSITSKVEVNGNTIEGTIYTPLEYAPYVEYGTGLFAENGNGRKTGWAYKDEETGETIWTRGQYPQPFLRPALKENKQKILNKIKEGITDG